MKYVYAILIVSFLTVIFGWLGGSISVLGFWDSAKSVFVDPHGRPAPDPFFVRLIGVLMGGAIGLLGSHYLLISREWLRAKQRVLEYVYAFLVISLVTGVFGCLGGGILAASWRPQGEPSFVVGIVGFVMGGAIGLLGSHLLLVIEREVSR